MKKYLGLVIMAGLLFSSSLALADHNEEKGNGEDSSFKHEDFREKIKSGQEAWRARFKTERESFIAELKSRKEEWRNASSEKRRMFWNGAQEIVSRRFEVAVTNLEKVQDRIEALIVKLEDEGKDTEVAEEYLDSSKETLAEAKEKLAEVKALLPDDGEKVTAEIFEKIKLGAREAKDLLKESHNDLILSIKEIKSVKEENN